MALTTAQIRLLMNKSRNIRNMSVIAHVDHGKTTLTDSLVAEAGLIHPSKIGERYTDSREDEQDRGITIKSTGVTLCFALEQQYVPANSDGNLFLVNLVDSPGHVDFSSEVTAALRVTDGALIVVDVVEGIRVQTGTVLRQALQERVKPVLMLNKIDRLILELKLSPEEIYQVCHRIIDELNMHISTYSEHTISEEIQSEFQLDPNKGNIAFGSGKLGWAFTIPSFSEYLSVKSKTPKEKIAEKMWGEHFWDEKNKEWTTDGRRDGVVRGFCKYAMNPICKLVNAVVENNQKAMEQMLAAVNISLKPEEKDLSGAKLLKLIMRKFLPAGPALFQMIVKHLPSPKDAQKYRLECLYEGPNDDNTAQSISTCDSNGPTLVYISKMIPSSSDGKRFIAFGRIFSGTLKCNSKVCIFEHVGNKKKQIQIQHVYLLLGRYYEQLDDVPAGNIIGISGIDYPVKYGTICSSDVPFPIQRMKFSVSPIVRVAIEPKYPSQFSQLVAALKNFVKSDPMAEIITPETGEIILACGGELHLEICLGDIKKIFLTESFEIYVSDPIVVYRETVTQNSKICMAKSPNKLCHVKFSVESIEEDVAHFLGENFSSSYEELKSNLAEKFSWEKKMCDKIWAFGPSGLCASMLVEQFPTAALAVDEYKDSVLTAFEMVSREGILTESPIFGCKFLLHEAAVPVSTTQKGGQILPAARRAMIGSYLTARPRLMEPVFLAEIQCTKSTLNSVYNTLGHRRSTVISEDFQIGSSFVVKAPDRKSVV